MAVFLLKFPLISSDSDAASPRQTQTDNDASGCPQRVAVRPPLPIVRVTALYLTNQKGFGTAPTESHTGDKWKRCLLATKKSRPTALCVGDARKPFWPVRCRPAEGAGRLPKRTAVAGVPLVRFDHSLSEYKQAFMSHGHCHKPRGTRSDVVILNLSPSSGI